MMRPLIEEFRRNPLFWLLVLVPVVLLAHAVNRDARTPTSSEDPSPKLARGAEYVDKLSCGSKPGDLLVEQRTNFDWLSILKTANELGLTVPPA